MAIYDCCMIFDEIDLLKIRMDLLNSIVDYFVVIESNKTFRGGDKKYTFLERKGEFSAWSDKIVYIKAENAPEWSGDGDWSIEKYQRNCMIEGLGNCREEDLIMISDVDEIPNPEIISNLSSLKRSIGGGGIRRRGYAVSGMSKREMGRLILGELSAEELLERFPILLLQSNHYYFMNCESKVAWPGTVICKFKNMMFPQTLRDKRMIFFNIKDAGWHFSYLGGIDQIKRKLSSIIDDRPEIINKMKAFSTQDDYIRDCLEKGEDLFGRKDGMNNFCFISPDKIGLPNIELLIKEYPEFFAPFYGKREKI